MLILTRRVGEKIRIEDDTIITLLGIKQGQISIGIDAPAHIPIYREEIYQRILAEKNLTAVNEASDQDKDV